MIIGMPLTWLVLVGIRLSTGGDRGFEIFTARLGPMPATLPRLFLPVACALLVLAFVPVRADEPVAEESQAIKVERVRDPAMVQYHKGYEMARRVQDAAEGRVQLLLRVLSSKAKQPVGTPAASAIDERQAGW